MRYLLFLCLFATIVCYKNSSQDYFNGLVFDNVTSEEPAIPDVPLGSDYSFFTEDDKVGIEGRFDFKTLDEKKEVIFKAVDSVIATHCPILVKDKAIELGDRAQFKLMINKLDYIEKLRDASSSARALKTIFGKIYLQISEPDKLTSRLSSEASNVSTRMKWERTFWHETLHLFEFTYSEIDGQFEGKYDSDTEFAERHGSYYEDLLQNLWKLEDELEKTGKVSSSVLNMTKNIFDTAYKQYWRFWKSEDYTDDLMLFWNYTNVLISWGRISSIYSELSITEPAKIVQEIKKPSDDGFTIVFGRINNKTGKCDVDMMVSNFDDISKYQSSTHVIPITKNGYTAYLTIDYFNEVKGFLDKLCLAESVRYY